MPARDAGPGMSSWLIGACDHLRGRAFDPCWRTAGCNGETRARQPRRGGFDHGGTGVVATELDGCLAVADGDVGRRAATWGREGDAWPGGKFARPRLERERDGDVVADGLTTRIDDRHQ